MNDIWTKKKRSEVMSRVRSHGNKDTELALICFFRQKGICGWRRHVSLFGKPDFTFRDRQLPIFVDGCFWHSCPKHARQPKSKRAFWRRKLLANKARDRFVTRTLRSNRWRVLRMWEHELAIKNEGKLFQRIQRALKI